MGNEITEQVANTACDPVVTNEQMGKNMSVNFTPLDPKAIAYPCGLIAKSLFNDTYSLSILSETDPTSAFFLNPIEIDSNNIAWQSDVDYKFKN